MRTALIVLASLLTLPLVAAAQTHNDAFCRPSLVPRATGGPQVADTAFRPQLPASVFAMGTGPHVYLDEAHNNFHTVEGRYAPFVSVLRRDGFVVDPLRAAFTTASLAPAKILVIANAMAEQNKANWTLPTPSAFTQQEIEAVRRWVSAGGSLFLIADHMPFGGATADLASAFGIYMTNGFATDRTCNTDDSSSRAATEPLRRIRS